MSYSTHSNLKQLYESIDEMTTKISDLTFSGSGPNDLTPIIIPNRNLVSADTIVHFHIEIIYIGTLVNKMSWSDQGSGGAGWTGENVIINGKNQNLNHGIAVKFSETFGHVLNDWWRFTLNAANSDDERDMAYNWINDRLKSYISVPVTDPTETLILAEANFAISLILRAKGKEGFEDFRDEATRLIDELLTSPPPMVETAEARIETPTLAGS